MMKPRGKNQKRFTLIELLIVIVIMGVLVFAMAVVIPNIRQFLGRGGTEANKTEQQNIQSAVFNLMVDNNLSTLVTPVGTATADMTAFPDTTANTVKTDANGVACLVTDASNWNLFGTDVICRDASTTIGSVNYVASATTKCTYTADAAGTVTQVSC